MEAIATQQLVGQTQRTTSCYGLESLSGLSEAYSLLRIITGNIICRQLAQGTIKEMMEKEI